jgi:hypothetical protein
MLNLFDISPYWAKDPPTPSRCFNYIAPAYAEKPPFINPTPQNGTCYGFKVLRIWVTLIESTS